MLRILDNPYIDYCAFLGKKYGSNLEGAGVVWGYPMLTYYTYEANNILSIVVTYGTLGTDILHPEYLVYNFDLTNGTLMNYTQLLNKFNLSFDNAKKKVVDNVNQYVDASEIYILERKDTTLEKLKDKVDNGTILYFVDNGGNIGYIVDIYMNAGNGVYPQKFIIAK